MFSVATIQQVLAVEFFVVFCVDCDFRLAPIKRLGRLEPVDHRVRRAADGNDRHSVVLFLKVHVSSGQYLLAT